MTMKWQHINTAPSWERVLVYQREEHRTKSCNTGIFTAVRVAPDKWNLTGLNGNTDREGNLDPLPTHWMPLPDIPKITEDKFHA